MSVADTEKTSMERLLEVAGEITTKEIATMLGEKYTEQTVNNWKTRGVSAEGAIDAGAAFEVNPKWIREGTPPKYFSNQNSVKFINNKIHEISPENILIPETPVISEVAAGAWTEVRSVDLSEVVEYIPYNKDAGANGFALIVSGKSMAPWFLPDHRIYVNPDLAGLASNEDLVIAQCDFDTKATFKQLIIEMGQKYLVPLNTDWPGPQHIPLDRHCKIIGLVVGAYVPINKRSYR